MPIGTTHTVRAVARHVSGVATHAADDVGCEVASLRAIVFTVADFATILAGLILVVTKGTIQGGKLAKLVALKFVLAFGDGGSLR